MFISGRITSAVVAASTFVALACVPALAHSYKLGALEIGHPWARATPAGASVGGGYLSVKNTGSAPDRLVRITSDVAGRSELHQMSMDNGVMRMRPLGDGVTIQPGETVTFAPGGKHIMFIGLKQPLKEGGSFKGTLEFEKAGKVDVDFEVEGIGARGPDHQAGGHTGGDHMNGDHMH